MNLLEMQSSVRQEKSISRSLSNEFIQAWHTAQDEQQQEIERARTKLLTLAATW